ncbi:MAG: outer membrane protein [Candidatus Acidiferrales bacterium]
MRKILVLCGAILALSLTASAQDSTVTLAAPSPAGDPAAQRQSTSVDEFNKQVAVGYQFADFRNLDGVSFRNNGLNFGFAWFLNDWVGVEADLGTGFGSWSSTTLHVVGQDQKTLFAGGGARFGYRRNRKVEPWGHVLVGVGYYHLFQLGALGSNAGLGYVAGGGIDYKLAPRLYLRVEGDYLGTRVLGGNQQNFQVIAGPAFNF